MSPRHPTRPTTPHRRGRALAAALGTALALTLPVATGAGAASERGPAVHRVTITAADYSLRAPTSVPAGPAVIRIENDGAEPHQAALVRLKPGTSASLYLGALAEGFGAASKVGTFVAGPNGAEPGRSVEVRADLAPGHYLVLCLIPSPDGTPHVLKGMSTELDVTGRSPRGSSARRAPTVHLDEYRFELPKGFAKAVGRGTTVEVVNDGELDHEMVVARLPKGVTVADVVTWSDHPPFTPEPGPAPHVDLAGATMIAPSGRARLKLDLPKGRYALVCYLPVDGTASSHLLEGMAYPFTVR